MGSICTTNDVTGAITCTPTTSPPAANTPPPQPTEESAGNPPPNPVLGGAGPISAARYSLNQFADYYNWTITGIGSLEEFKNALKGLTLEGMPNATTQQKANAIKSILDNLRGALANPHSRYDLEKVKDVLEQRGLTLADIAALQGKNGEQLIAALLTQLGLDPRQFESQTITDLNTLSALLDDPNVTAAQIKANPAFAALRDVEGGKLDIYAFAVIESANNKLAQLEGIESEAAAVAAAQAAALAAEAEQASLAGIMANSAIQEANTLDKLLTVLDKHRDAIDSNPEIKLAFGKKALELIAANPTVSAEDFATLSSYLRLQPNQRLVSFLDGNAHYIILIEGSDTQGWTIISAGLPDKRYYIKVESGKIIVGCEDGCPDPTFVSEVMDLPSASIDSAAASPDSAVQRRQMFTLMGIDFVDATGNPDMTRLIAEADKDGDRQLDLGELREYAKAKGIEILLDFFQAVDGDMVVGKDGDGVLTLAELQRAVEVIGRYAAILGLSFEDAAKLYFSSSLENKDFTALEAAGASISQALADKSYTTFATEDEGRIALTELGYNSDIINNVIALIDFTNQATAQFVIACIMRVVVVSYPAGQPLTKEKILAWLCGEALIDDSQITRNDAFNGIFLVCASSRESGSGLRAATAYINDQLIAGGQLELAERAVELIMQKARELGAEELQSPYHELLSLENNSALLELFAVAYMQKGNYQKALEYARGMTGSNKDQTLYNISQSCITSITNDTDPAAVRARLELALTIAKEIQGTTRDQALENLFNVCIQQKLFDLAYKIEEGWTSDSKRKERLQQLVEACRYSTDSYAVAGQEREARQIALDAINLMVNLFGEDALIEVEQNNQKVSIKLGDYKQQVTDELRMPLSIQIIKNGVLSRTEPPSIIGDAAAAAAAINELNGIILNPSGEVRAHALLVLAQILKAQADALWQQGVSGDPAKTDAFKIYELMARVAREAALAFAQLRGGSTGSTAEYYNKMGIESCDIIAEVVYANRNNWLERQKWGNPTRPSNWADYLSAFKTLTKYIPEGSTVTNFDRRGEGDSQTQSSMLFKRILDLLSDQEHSANYLNSHDYPEDIAELYAAIMISHMI